MHFTKMHGLGNDYLYFFGEVPDNVSELSVKLSDRHFGAGSDGLIYISPSQTADFKMRIFNADGSEAMMCGNGIRCVGKYVYDKGYTDKTVLNIETLSGNKELKLQMGRNTVKAVSVRMGKAEVGDPVRIEVGGRKLSCIPVSVGNPHAVIFTEDPLDRIAEELGPLVEHHELFPGGVNVEFVQVITADGLRMRVWERGSGVTLACGTGACASAAAAVHLGYCKPETPVTVRLDGGLLEITVGEDYSVIMSGPAETVYEGDYE